MSDKMVSEFDVLEQCYCMKDEPELQKCQYCLIKEMLANVMRENERLTERLDEIEYVAQCLKAECMINGKTHKEMLNWAHDKIGNRLIEICDIEQPFLRMAIDGKRPSKTSDT